jgi:hypothetical protein
VSSRSGRGRGQRHRESGSSIDGTKRLPSSIASDARLARPRQTGESLAEDVFVLCPENRARFLEPLLRFPRLAHHARFCQVTDVGFAASALGDRGGSGLSLEMPGPRGARSPRSVEAGEPTGVRADGTGAWTASREADAVPSAGGTISNEHLWRRGRAGNAPSRRERRRHAGRRRRRWRVRRPFLTGRVRTRLCARARAVMSRRSRPVRRSSWNPDDTEPSQRIESLSGLVPPDPAKKQQPSAPRRHQISGARRRACGDGAARGASSPRGG